MSTLLSRTVQSQTARTLSRTSHCNRIGRLPLKDLAIKWPSCEMFGHRGVIDSANEHPPANCVDDG